MKVLVISHTYIARINRDKWKVLASRYPTHTLTVIIPQRWPTHLFVHEAGTVSEENLPNCTFIALPTAHSGNEVRYRYPLRALLGIIKNTKPDLIHVEQGDNALSYFESIICSKFLRSTTKTVFFTWINWRPQFSLKYRLFWKPIEHYNLSHAHGAIAGNNDAKIILEEKKFTQPIMVLPQLGVNCTIFTPTLKTHNNLTIGYIGRFVEEKGIMLLLSAFAELSPQFPQWHLTLVGDGPLHKHMQEFITQHHLEKRVAIKPPVTHHEVASLMQQLNLFVLPSFDTTEWKEQFGHVLIEAMACKIPVLGSTAGEIPHVIGNAGALFEQKNYSSLVAQLSSLLHNESLRISLGEKGYHRATTYYSHEAIADATVTFWHHIVGSNIV